MQNEASMADVRFETLIFVGYLNDNSETVFKCLEPTGKWFWIECILSEANTSFHLGCKWINFTFIICLFFLFTSSSMSSVG